MGRTGRINRATYWVLLAGTTVLIALVLATTKVHVPGEVVLAFIAAPRLRDIGLSAWWVVAGVGFEAAGAIGALFLLPEQPALIAIGVVVLALFGLLIWLGCIKGQPGDNQFGAAPPPGLFGRAAMKQG